MRRAGFLSLCVLAVALLAPSAWAQNLVRDGQVYYAIGPTTLNTSLIDVDPIANLEHGNNLVIGRAPAGAYGSEGDVNLTPPFTVVLATGAQMTTIGADNPGVDTGYYAGVSVFNGCRLVVDNYVSLDSTPYIRPHAPIITAYDNSQLEINGATNVGPTDAPNYNIALVFVRDNSQLTVNGNVISNIAGLDQGQTTFNNGYASNASFELSSHLLMTGGTIANLSAIDNTTLEMQGGTWSGLSFIEGSSQFTMTGGTINALYLIDNGQATINGETATVLYSHAVDNSSLIVNGGTIQGVDLYDKATLNFHDGLVTAPINAQGNSHIDVSGGTINSLNASESALTDLHGGTVSGPIHLLDTSSLNIYGNGLIITGQTPWSETIDGNVRNGIAYTVTGFLEKNGNTLSSFLLYDQDGGYTDISLNPSQQFALINTGGGSPVTVDGKIYYITAPLTVNASLSGYDVVIGRAPGGVYGAVGDANLGTTDGDKYTVTLGPGTNTNQNGDLTDGYEGVHVFNKNTALLTGGFVSQMSVHDSATADIGGNAFVSTLNTFDGSQTVFHGAGLAQAELRGSSRLDMSAGTAGTITARDNAMVSITNGTINTLTTFDSAHADMSGGTLTQLITSDSSTADITGGTIGHVETHGSSIVNLRGGKVAGANGNEFDDSRTYDNSVLNISGGTLNFLHGFGSSTINISGGAVGSTSLGIGLVENSTLNVSGGTVNFIESTANNRVNITGGTIGSVDPGSAYGILAYGSSAVSISGGKILRVDAAGNAQLSLSGTADIGFLYTNGDATTNISGGTIGVVSFIPTGSLIADGNSVLNIRGGTIRNTLEVLNHATANISGGTVGTGSGNLYLIGHSTLNVSGGDVVGIASMSDGDINVTGGNIGSYNPALGQIVGISSSDGNTNVSGGKVLDVQSLVGNHLSVSGTANIVTASVKDSATADMTGGAIGNLAAGDKSILHISGGKILNISADGNSTVTVTGGAIGERLSPALATGGIVAQENSTINVREGTIIAILTGGGASPATSKINVSGGTIEGIVTDGKSHLTVSDSANISDLLTAGNAVNDIFGGTITSTSLYNTSVTTLYGGHIGTVYQFDQSTLNIFGGTIGNNTIYALGDSFTNLIADTYTFGDPFAATYLDPDSGILYTGFYHDLSAVFGDGSQFSTRYFEAVSDSNGTFYHPQFIGSDGASAAPEVPSGWLCLTGIVLYGICCRRFRSTSQR